MRDPLVPRAAVRLASPGVLALALIAAFITACGDDDDDDDNQSATPSTETATRTPTATTGESPESTPEEETSAGTWEELAALPLGLRQEHGVAALGGEVYVVGGFDTTGNIVRTVEVYDPTNDSWRRAADIPIAMHHVNIATVGERIYVVGFLVGSFEGNGTVFEYDPSTDAWTEKTPMPEGTERGASGVAVVDDVIYVAGGFRGGGAVADFSAYDPAADSWQELPALSSPRDHLTAGAIDGLVYVAGGRRGQIHTHIDTLEAFDPATGAWEQRAPMPTSRGGIAGAVLEGRFYVFGGEGNQSTASGVYDNAEAYDPQTDTWQELTPMRTPRHGMGAAVIDGVIYVPGGADVQAFGAVDTNEAFLPP
jgi:N-acetylneuraminic acid mutarotase